MTIRKIKPLTGFNLSSHGFVLRPVYRESGPPTVLTGEDRVFDPKFDRTTALPTMHGSIKDKVGFSTLYNRPMSIDLLIKAPQSDVHYFPDECKQFREFLEYAIGIEWNRSPAAFTQAGFIQIRQGMPSPAPRWHVDIGSPGKAYLAADRGPTIYAGKIPLLVTKELRKIFRESALTAEEKRNYFVESLPPRIQDLKETTFNPYDVVSHNHRVLHSGPRRMTRRTGVFLSYVDADIPPREGFKIAPNPMRPGMEKIQSAPLEEAADRLAHYYRRYRLENRSLGL